MAVVVTEGMVGGAVAGPGRRSSSDPLLLVVAVSLMSLLFGSANAFLMKSR